MNKGERLRRVLGARTSLVMAGRSMIEMLGVLAIIGVLSAGGIWGYTAAMETYRANKLMEAVQQTIIGALNLYVKPNKNVANYQSIGCQSLYKAGILSEDLYDDGACVPKKLGIEHTSQIAVYEYNDCRFGTDLMRSAPCAYFPPIFYWVSKPLCVKWLTYDWRSSGVIAFHLYVNRYSLSDAGMGKYTCKNVPCTVAQAEEYCNAPKLQIGGHFYIHGIPINRI